MLKITILTANQKITQKFRKKIFFQNECQFYYTLIIGFWQTYFEKNPELGQIADGRFLVRRPFKQRAHNYFSR